MTTFYKLPNGQFIKREKSYGTKYTQNRETGKMTGRKEVRGIGDKTGVQRVKKDFVLVKKSKTARGHIRTLKQDYKEGQIIGRF